MAAALGLLIANWPYWWIVLGAAIAYGIGDAAVHAWKRNRAGGHQGE
jgi:hypothetical protein